MKRFILMLFVFFFTMVVVSAPGAGDFDGTKPLLISIIRVIECTPDGTCNEVTPASAELPQFMKIDFTNKTIRPATGDDKMPNHTAIERQEVVDGKLILQGAEDGYDKMRDGLGWTMAISEENGQVVLTASGEQVAFVIFGASLPM
jgi:hypothetical protein